MFINAIGFKPPCNPQQPRNLSFNGKSGYAFANPEYRDEFVSQKLSKHEENIINVMGKEEYIKLCREVDETEKMILSQLLNTLDDDSIIIMIGNSDKVKADLENLLATEPNINKNIKKAYLLRNSKYEYPVFITTSKQTNLHGDPMFMVHSKGKLRLQSPFWSPAQTRTAKNTRYLTYGDVVKVDFDGHYIKFEKPNTGIRTPKGISIQDIDNLTNQTLDV